MIFTKKKTPVFILGCQRSGTTICQNVFLASKRFAVFREGNKAAMTDDWRLRPTAEIRALIDKSKAKFLIFKPINDSQFGDAFLRDFEHARIVWIYRSVDDTANSAVAKWGAAQRDMVCWIAACIRETSNMEEALSRMSVRKNYSIYAERMTPDVRDNLLAWTEKPVSEHTGAAILWYLRNHIFLDLGFEDNARVLPVCYERFVRKPATEIARICSFIGAPYSEKLAEGVRTSSIGKHDSPVIATSVRKACEVLAEEFDKAEARRRAE